MRLIVFLLLAALIPGMAFAKTETFFAASTYRLSDNDSRNDARRLAYLEARKLVLEKAVSFIVNTPQAVDNSISEQEVKSYIGAIVNAAVDKEEFDSSSGSQTLKLSVKAAIDIEPLVTTLAIIRSDVNLQEKVIKEQKQLKELESRLKILQEKIYSESKSESALYLRENRADILAKIADNDSDVVSGIEALLNNINTISAKVIKNVRNGMTRQELADIMGKYRLAASYNNNIKPVFCQNYGKYWVIIENNIVTCYIKYPDYKGCNPATLDKLIAFEELVK